MNRAKWLLLPLLTLLTLGTTSSAKAADFWDMIFSNSGIYFQGTNPNPYLDSKVNGATVLTGWIDNVNGGLPLVFDGIDQLSGTLDIYDRNGVLLLQSPAFLTRDGLNAWAAANAATIFQALFPAGLSELTGATDDNILASTTVSQNLFKKAAPAKKNQNNAEAAKNEAAEADAEYQNLKVNGYSGRASSLVMAFSKKAGSGLDYSLTVPYRSTVINDNLGSRSRFLGLEIAAKYPLIKWDTNEWNLGACLFGSAFTVKTDNVNKTGNLKYGGGAFTSINRDLGFGIIGVGLDYRLAKARMPASMNSDDIFFEQAADYVNHHSPIQTISYGFNLGIPMAGEVAAVNFEVIRSNFVSNDIPDGQKAKTSVGLAFSFYPSNTFELNLGVGRDYELDKVDSMGIKLGVVNRF